MTREHLPDRRPKYIRAKYTLWIATTHGPDTVRKLIVNFAWNQMEQGKVSLLACYRAMYWLMNNIIQQTWIFRYTSRFRSQLIDLLSMVVGKLCCNTYFVCVSEVCLFVVEWLIMPDITHNGNWIIECISCYISLKLKRIYQQDIRMGVVCASQSKAMFQNTR